MTNSAAWGNLQGSTTCDCGLESQTTQHLSQCSPSQGILLPTRSGRLQLHGSRWWQIVEEQNLMKRQKKKRKILLSTNVILYTYVKSNIFCTRCITPKRVTSLRGLRVLVPGQNNFRKNVAAMASHWQHCVRLIGPRFQPDLPFQRGRGTYRSINRPVLNIRTLRFGVKLWAGILRVTEKSVFFSNSIAISFASLINACARTNSWRNRDILVRKVHSLNINRSIKTTVQEYYEIRGKVQVKCQL